MNVTYHKTYDTDDNNTKSIIKMRRQACERLSTNDAVQYKEALHGEDIQDRRYDGTEIPPREPCLYHSSRAKLWPENSKERRQQADHQIDNDDDD